MSPLIAVIALTILTSGPANLDDTMVVGPHPDPSILRNACSGFAANAERLGWGKLKPVASLPDGKMERLVVLNVAGCPAREVLKSGLVYLVQGDTAYIATALPRSDEMENQSQ